MHRYRSWSAIVVVTAVVYGVIGVFAFGVLIDYVRLAGACGLLIATALSSGRTVDPDARVGQSMPLPSRAMSSRESLPTVT
jgi:hypothetical protein